MLLVGQQVFGLSMKVGRIGKEALRKPCISKGKHIFLPCHPLRFLLREALLHCG